ncbi:MAG: arsenic efflux protein [Erysipelotrichales bacterium]|nr:arsenic efflux protein [Erysipelotrichales bacterium]
MEIVLHILTHAFEDTIKMIPLIVLTYIILDIYERNSDINTKINLILNSKTGPIFGALIGCIPQCGFAFLAATLFTNNLVSAGTMVAVFIATSDEALPMLLANPSEYKSLLLLIVTKIIFAIIAGYTLDFILSLTKKKQEVEEIEEDDDEELELTISDPTCNCGNSMLENVVRRSLRVLIFVFVITALFSFVIEGIGEDTISTFLESTYVIQPFITAAFGFIPNCAVSIIMTELFLVHGLSFGALIAGLSVNAGIGSLVLIKEHKDKKETYFILGFMYTASVIVGLILTAIL